MWILWTTPACVCVCVLSYGCLCLIVDCLQHPHICERDVHASECTHVHKVRIKLAVLSRYWWLINNRGMGESLSTGVAVGGGGVRSGGVDRWEQDGRSLSRFTHGADFMNDQLIVDLMESGGSVEWWMAVLLLSQGPVVLTVMSSTLQGTGWSNTPRRQLSQPPY